MVDFANIQAKQLLDGGLTPNFDDGLIELYSGTSPGADNSATGDLLATITMPATAFSGATDDAPGALATATMISDTSGTGDGVVGYARAIRDGGSTTICDMTINVDFTMTNPNISVGSPIEVDSFTIFQPETP